MMNTEKMKIFFFLSLLFFSPLMESAKANYLSPSQEEAKARAFGRVFRNLQTVFQQNADDISTLNQEEFFKNYKKMLSPKSAKALLHMRDNTECGIIQSYIANIALLKEDLKETKACFKENQTAADLKEDEVRSLKKYVKALLIIISKFR